MARGKYEKAIAKKRGEAYSDEPEVPEEMLYLWRHYWQLRRGEALRYSEVIDYQNATGWVLEGWEVDVLMKMDAAVESQLAEERKAT